MASTNNDTLTSYLSLLMTFGLDTWEQPGNRRGHRDLGLPPSGISGGGLTPIYLVSGPR